MSARRALTWAGRGVAGLVSAALLAGIGFGWATYRDAVDDLVTDDVIVADPSAPDPGPPAPDAPRTDQTILLVGIDSRTDTHGDPLPQHVLDHLHAGDATGVRNTDTMIVVHVPADPDRTAFAVSLPRDSYVDIAGGFGRHKLNSAYARAMNAKADELRASGAAEAVVERKSRTAGRRNLIATVNALTGLRVNHYAEINLYGFSEITKAVGGVPVCLTAPVDDEFSGAEFPAGHQLLAGVDALKFVRQRHGLPNGDLDRVRRQQAFLAGLANRMFSAGTLTDPARVTALVDALTRSVVLDEDWDLLGFAQQVADLSGDRLEFSTIPTGRSNLETPYDGSAVEVDPEEVRAYFAALLGDQPAKGKPGGDGRAPVREPLAEDRYGITTPAGQGDEGDEEPITADGVPCVN
ncbi:LCP family protein [Actinophytocola gossypii]|uniref:LCP family protein n=1 Tax=Actinophytocola gossypii TaxID=2812003 RepID=A0ABT2J763_9PSEU|nr:LCP family protein [Actinophytocola gossypii]MCT2583702.1 LCP family protein [Actinophytocola gossypii]